MRQEWLCIISFISDIQIYPKKFTKKKTKTVKAWTIIPKVNEMLKGEPIEFLTACLNSINAASGRNAKVVPLSSTVPSFPLKALGSKDKGFPAT